MHRLSSLASQALLASQLRLTLAAKNICTVILCLLLLPVRLNKVFASRLEQCTCLCVNLLLIRVYLFVGSLLKYVLHMYLHAWMCIHACMRAWASAWPTLAKPDQPGPLVTSRRHAAPVYRFPAMLYETWLCPFRLSPVSGNHSGDSRVQPSVVAQSIQHWTVPLRALGLPRYSISSVPTLIIFLRMADRDLRRTVLWSSYGTMLQALLHRQYWLQAPTCSFSVVQ
jgi:hypothetical protein